MAPPSVPDLPAGEFGRWIADIVEAIAGRGDADVPCAGCTACCRSGQFIHIGPDERDALAHIPKVLLFAAPRMPKGHVLMGYDDRGCCPMLIDDRCSIYEHRPRTCRTYDCRVFPASGLDAGTDDKPLIAERARRWQFSYLSPHDRAAHDAVRAAATFLDAHRTSMPAGSVPATATHLAVQAVEVHDVFIAAEPSLEAVRVAIGRRPGGS